ncbi:MAG: hypothetical protein ACOYD4_17190 [Solirubrobacterales bacterium]
MFEEIDLVPGAPALSSVACDELLQARILAREPEAVEAALALMERHDPKTLREALWLVDDGRHVSAPSFEIVAAAWDRYFHIRSMPWD